MRFDTVNAPLSELPQRAAMAARALRNEKCPLCAVGDTPFKMKRQTVHHIPATGRVIVCEDATLKPTS